MNFICKVNSTNDTDSFNDANFVPITADIFELNNMKCI